MEQKEKYSKFFYFSLISGLLANFGFLLASLYVLGDIRDTIAGNQIIASIVTSEEDETFIKRICDDLGLENRVSVVVGPYYIQSFLSPAHNYRLNRLLTKYPITVDPFDPTRRVLMKESVYKEATTEERRFLIAHEIWHIYQFIRNNNQPPPNTSDTEIEANRFATRYVQPDVPIGLYRKYGDGSEEVQRLIRELELRGH